MRTTDSLREALDEIEQIDLDSLPDDELDSFVADLGRTLAQGRAELDRVIAELAGRSSR